MRCHARLGDCASALHVDQECAALLKKELGVAPGAVTRLTYREILDLDAAAPITPAPPRPAMYPLIGRGSEWHTVLRTWAEADGGLARLCVIRGEAGIGKRRLAEELADWCSGHGAHAGPQVIFGVDPDPANDAAITSWCKDYFDALHPYSARGAYVNCMMDEGQERVQAAFRDNYARLALIKSHYDPANLFRVNQNIRPATTGV